MPPRPSPIPAPDPAPIRAADPSVWRIESTPRTRSATRIDAVIATLAGRQDGVVHRAQLVDAGIGAASIARRLCDGRLHQRYPGVYAVGHACLTVRGRWLAAVFAGGRGAVLSHRSAAVAHGLVERDVSWVDVTVRHARGRELTGIRAHRCKLADGDVESLGGVPITTVQRTLLDLAETVPQREVDRAIDAAVRGRRLDLAAVDALIERSGGRHGLKRLRRGVAKLRPDAGRTRSEMERRAATMIARYRLPPAEINEKVLGYEVDLLWRERRLVVELDSLEFHLTPLAFETDRRRDAELTVAGYDVLRFTWAQTTRETAWVARTIRAVLERRVAD